MQKGKPTKKLDEFLIVYRGIVDPRKFYTEDGREIDLKKTKPEQYIITIEK